MSDRFRGYTAVLSNQPVNSVRKTSAKTLFSTLGESDIKYVYDPGKGKLTARSADPILVQVRGIPGGGIVHCLNSGESEIARVIDLERLGLANAKQAWFWNEGRSEEIDQRKLPVQLKPHTSVLIWVTEKRVEKSGFSIDRKE